MVRKYLVSESGITPVFFQITLLLDVYSLAHTSQLNLLATCHQIVLYAAPSRGRLRAVVWGSRVLELRVIETPNTRMENYCTQSPQLGAAYRTILSTHPS